MKFSSKGKRHRKNLWKIRKIRALEPLFLLFICYFHSRLQEKKNIYQVVDIFREVIASLSYQEFGGSPPPDGFVVLTTLPWEEKERYYRRFPMIAMLLFPDRVAIKLIAEFHRFNRISDGAI